MKKFLKRIGLVSRDIQDLTEDEKKEITDFISFGIPCPTYLKTNNISPFVLIDLLPSAMADKKKRMDTINNITGLLENEEETGFRSAKSKFENFVSSTIERTSNLLEKVNLNVEGTSYKGVIVAVVKNPGYYKTYILEHYGKFVTIYVDNENKFKLGFVGEDVTSFYEQAYEWYSSVINYEG